jgi:isoamylase
MLSHGDEAGRTQRGNNNAYCQDNELSWMNWSDSPENEVLRAFVQRVTDLRREHPVFRRRRFPTGEGDVTWYTTTGRPMTDADWETPYAKAITVFLDGERITEPDRRGEPIRDDSFLLLFNAADIDLNFVLPDTGGGMWTGVLDTATPIEVYEYHERPVLRSGEKVRVEASSIQVLRRV